MKKIKVLFFAEGATLAHVVRPFVLARALDRDKFDIIFCRPSAYTKFTITSDFPLVDLHCQDSTTFSKRLKWGLPLYDLDTLHRYAAEDIQLIQQFQPDVVVGDFRLSLSASARKLSVPYAAVCDAYWAAGGLQAPPMPVLGTTRLPPTRLAEALFKRIAPTAFKIHAHPLEQLRKHFGLPALNHDLCRCYTDADHCFYANFQELFPSVSPSNSASFIGPVNWSPSFAGNLAFLDAPGPLAYVTMGSSGDPRVIEKLAPILQAKKFRVAIATAGKRVRLSEAAPELRIFDFLPGDLVCSKANLVICNGGSPSTNQALAQGVPVVGVPLNMDQFLNMRAVVKYGAGRMVRADSTGTAQITEAIDDASSPEKHTMALRLADAGRATETTAIFTRILSQQGCPS